MRQAVPKIDYGLITQELNKIIQAVSGSIRLQRQKLKVFDNLEYVPKDIKPLINFYHICILTMIPNVIRLGEPYDSRGKEENYSIALSNILERLGRARTEIEALLNLSDNDMPTRGDATLRMLYQIDAFNNLTHSFYFINGDNSKDEPNGSSNTRETSRERFEEDFYIARQYGRSREELNEKELNYEHHLKQFINRAVTELSTQMDMGGCDKLWLKSYKDLLNRSRPTR